MYVPLTDTLRGAEILAKMMHGGGTKYTAAVHVCIVHTYSSGVFFIPVVYSNGFECDIVGGTYIFRHPIQVLESYYGYA